MHDKAAVFLDRDGTIVEEGIHDKLSCGNMHMTDVKLIEGTAEAIVKLNKNFIVIIITNQSAIAKEFCTEEDVEKTNRHIVYLLAEKGARIDSIYYCPHHPDTSHVINKYRIECGCRKPEPGMLKTAAADHKLDLTKCWMVGDRTIDIGAGKSAGCKTILVKTGYAGEDSKYDAKPDFIATDLMEASDIILKHMNDKKIKSGQVSITQAVILAGGRGERLRPLTDDLPKPMLPVAGKPLLEWHMLNLKRHGVKDVIICASYKAEKIKEYFGSQWNGMKIMYPEEPVPQGTGGALKNAEKYINTNGSLLDDNFYLVNADIATVADFSSLSDFHLKKNSLATLVVRRTEHPKDSDVLDVDENYRVIGFIGKGQEMKNLGNTGIFAINRKLLSKIPEGFSILEKDVISKNLDLPIFAFITDNYTRDMGTMERYEIVKMDFPIVLRGANLG